MHSEPVRDPAASRTLLHTLLDRCRCDRIEIVQLTDEEVALLDAPGADHVAPLPWLEAVPPEHRDTALAVAARNLVVRGLALPSLLDDCTGDLSIALPVDVHAVLVARRAASTVAIAQRRTAEVTATRVLYVQGGDGSVEEHVSPGGLHTFTAGPLDAAVRELAGFADPDGAASVDGESDELNLADIATGSAPVDRLAESRHVTVVSVVALGRGGEPVERRLSVYALPDRVMVAEPLADRPILAVRSVDPGSLLNALRQVTRGVETA
jgi:hypothetical protein